MPRGVASRAGPRTPTPGPWQCGGVVAPVSRAVAKRCGEMLWLMEWLGDREPGNGEVSDVGKLEDYIPRLISFHGNMIFY